MELGEDSIQSLRHSAFKCPVFSLDAKRSRRPISTIHTSISQSLLCKLAGRRARWSGKFSEVGPFSHSHTVSVFHFRLLLLRLLLLLLLLLLLSRWLPAISSCVLFSLSLGGLASTFLCPPVQTTISSTVVWCIYRICGLDVSAAVWRFK